MRRVVVIGGLLTGVALAAGGCVHEQDLPPLPPPRNAPVGVSPLAPFDSVDVPHPNSREQLAAALRNRGFFRRMPPREPSWGAPSARSRRVRGCPRPAFRTIRRWAAWGSTRAPETGPWTPCPSGARARPAPAWAT